MTEKDFWEFLNNALSKGRPTVISGTMDTEDEDIDNAGQFIRGHAYLPTNYDKIALEVISDMGDLLNKGKASLKAKEAILILLAHHPSIQALNALKLYNKRPDKELRIFAEIALDECKMWNE